MEVVEVAVDAVEVDRVIDQWSLVRGLCGVIYGLRFLEFFS